MNIRRLFIIALAVCMSTACSSSRKAATGMAYADGGCKESVSDDGRLIRRTLPLRDFNEIECYWITTLKYRQSSEYSVALTTTAKGHELANVYVDGSKLCLKWKGRVELEKGMVILEVSCPNPRLIECFGETVAELSDIDTGDFILTAGSMSSVSTGRIKGTDVKIDKHGTANLSMGAVHASGNLTIKAGGMGKLTAADVSGSNVSMNKYGTADLCVGPVRASGDLRIEAGGMGIISTADINCQSIKIDKSGTANIDSGNITSSGTFDISCGGMGTLVMGDTEAPAIRLTATGTAQIRSGKMSGTTLSINQGGMGNSILTYKGDRADISSSGARSMNIGVDCNKLNVVHTGMSAITITGTADDVKIEGSGAAAVNCSGLNRY